MDDLRRWEHAPISDLIDYIVRAYHRPLPATLARLVSLAPRGRDQLEHLRDLVVEHLREEEELVFPWLRSRERSSAGVLVHLLERDHREIERSLGELDVLVDIADASREARAFAIAFREIAGALRALFRFENTVLFPRALVGTD